MKKRAITIFKQHSNMKRKYQREVNVLVKARIRYIGRRDAKKYQLPSIIDNTLKSPYLTTLEKQSRHLQNQIWLVATRDIAPLKLEAAKLVNDFQKYKNQSSELETTLARNTQPLSLERRLGEEETEEGLLLERRQKEQQKRLSPMQRQQSQLQANLQNTVSEASEIYQKLIELETLTREMTQMIRHHYQEKMSVYLEGATRNKRYPFYSKGASFQLDVTILENEKVYYDESKMLKKGLCRMLALVEEEETRHVD